MKQFQTKEKKSMLTFKKIHKKYKNNIKNYIHKKKILIKFN